MRRSASASALKDTTEVTVDLEQFLDRMRSSPEIIQSILRLLLAIIPESNARLSGDSYRSLAQSDVVFRIAVRSP